MTRHELKLLIVAVSLALLSALVLLIPTIAQDAPQPTPVATSAPQPDPDADTTTGTGFPWRLVSVALIALAAGYGLPKLIDSIRRDPQAIADLEARANRLPESITEGLVKISEIAESSARLVKALADRIPETDKPGELATYSTDEIIAELKRRGEHTP